MGEEARRNMQLQELKPREAVCLWDPAIANSIEEILEYSRTRAFDKLKWRDGTKPEVYSLRPMNSSIEIFVNSAANDVEKFARAFFACVVDVSNFVDSEGIAREKWRPESVMLHIERVGKMTDLFSAAEKELFPFGTILEIGQCAWAFSFFPKQIGLSLPLLPTSLQIWTAVSARSAEPAESTAEISASDAKPVEPQTAAVTTP